MPETSDKHLIAESIRRLMKTRVYAVEKALTNKTSVFPKSTNMDIWVVGITNQLFIRGSLTERKF